MAEGDQLFGSILLAGRSGTVSSFQPIVVHVFNL